MGELEETKRQPFFHYVKYVREDPHPKFTAFQLGFIRSIDEFLTPQEVDAVSEVESFEIRLEDGDVICSEVPGLRPQRGDFEVWVQRTSGERFAKFMEKVMDHIEAHPCGPKWFLRFITPFRILIKGIGTFYPLNCGPGDIERRDRVRRRMAEVGALTGEFENGKFVLSDGRVFPVAAMRIERSLYAGRGYAPDW